MAIKSAHWSYTTNSDGTTDHFLLAPEGVRSNVPVISADGSLMGPDGVIPTGGLGTKTLTVGEGGMFSTLQAAVDSLATSDCFVEFTPVSGWPASTTGWAQGFSTVSTGAIAPFFLDPPPTDIDKYWISVGSETKLYPIETMTGSTASDKIFTKYPRDEAEFTTGAIHYYREVPVSIVLLENKEYPLTFPIPLSIHLTSVAGSSRLVVLDTAEDVHYFSIYLGNGIIDSVSGGGFNKPVSGPARGTFYALPGSTLSSWGGDGQYFDGLATVTLTGCRLVQSVLHGASHNLMGYIAGDMVIRDVQLDIKCLDSATPSYSALMVMGGRNLRMYGVSVNIIDPANKLTKYTLLAPDASIEWATVSASNISFDSQHQTSCAPSVLDENLTGLNAAHAAAGSLNLQNISYNIGVFTSAANRVAFRTSSGGSNRTVNANGLINCTSDKASTGTLTVTATQLLTQSTGGGSAALGANCPAVTASAPFTWKAVILADGSTGYVPVWK